MQKWMDGGLCARTLFFGLLDVEGAFLVGGVANVGGFEVEPYLGFGGWINEMDAG